MLGQKIRKLMEVKEKIRQAIISKGVEVPECASLSELADKIEEIKVCKKKGKNNAKF